MLRTVSFCLGFVVVLTVMFTDIASSPTFPIGPTPQENSTVDVAQAAETPAPPVRVVIPSIKLDTNIAYMGIDKEGKMDVPSSRSSDAGWYKDGTVPGEVGSAVLAAHVVAAFKKLNRVRVGDDVYVAAADGAMLHFKIVETKTFAVKDLAPDLLFNRADAKRLNLITCAGKNLGGGNYTHRFVAFAELVEDEK